MRGPWPVWQNGFERGVKQHHAKLARVIPHAQLRRACGPVQADDAQRARARRQPKGAYSERLASRGHDAREDLLVSMPYLNAPGLSQALGSEYEVRFLAAGRIYAQGALAVHPA